jgi:hypothetical protein
MATNISKFALVTSSEINSARVWQPTLCVRVCDSTTNYIYVERLPGVYSAERYSSKR